MRRAIALAAGLTVVVGCQLTDELHDKKKRPPADPTFSQYHLDGWPWEAVGRVLVLPVLNESPYTNAGDEVRAALTGELQRVGRFEVIDAPPDDRAELARTIHRLGRFDEGVMLALGHKTRADVIVHATVTHYSPYPRPRLGLIVQAVGPREAKVVASVDGLWDTTDVAVADRVRTFYRQSEKERPAWVRNNVIAGEETFAAELALESPALFQRFVAREAVLTLLGLPVPGVMSGGLPPGAVVTDPPAADKEKAAKDKAAAPKGPPPKPIPPAKGP